jgi:DNA-binding transcriptional MerR regulator
MGRANVDYTLPATNGNVPDAMTISQLAEQTGVPPRRIRYYVSEGLLPPPNGRGRASHYNRAHLERLQHILALRDVNLSLEEIRERLDGLDDHAPASNGAPARDESWRRWQVVPGVEIHARDDLDERTLETVQVMVGAVRHVLQSGEPGSDHLAGPEE